MPHQEPATFSGKITHIFAHRFVLQRDDTTILVDLTPDGAHAAKWEIGDDITVWGEMKSSELKVERFTRNGDEATSIKAQHKGRDGQQDAGPATAINTAISNGYEVVGMPRRKPKHFEVLGRAKSGEMSELHIDLDGRLSKTKSADVEKWASDIRLA